MPRPSVSRDPAISIAPPSSVHSISWTDMTAPNGEEAVGGHRHGMHSLCYLRAPPQNSELGSPRLFRMCRKDVRLGAFDGYGSLQQPQNGAFRQECTCARTDVLRAGTVPDQARLIVSNRRPPLPRRSLGSRSKKRSLKGGRFSFAERTLADPPCSRERLNDPARPGSLGQPTKAKAAPHNEKVSRAISTGSTEPAASVFPALEANVHLDPAVRQHDAK
jgi:hypothetical protein